MAGPRFEGAAQYVPDQASLDELRTAAAACHGCDLYKGAEQTVFGAGPSSARIVFVGEQPGDQEDREGTPFAVVCSTRSTNICSLGYPAPTPMMSRRTFQFTRRGEGNAGSREANTTEVYRRAGPGWSTSSASSRPELLRATRRHRVPKHCSERPSGSPANAAPITPGPDGLPFSRTIHPLPSAREYRDRVYDGLYRPIYASSPT